MSRALLFFDVDGTLVNSPYERDISESTKTAVRKAREKGALCFIASGRSYGGCAALMTDLFDGCVFSDGAGIYMRDTGMVMEEIDPVDVQYILQDVQTKYDAGIAMSGIQNAYANDAEYRFFQEYMEGFDDAPDTEMDLLHADSYTDEPILEIDISFKNAKDEKDFTDHLPSGLHYISTSASYGRGENTSGELTKRGITKGYGVQKVAEMLGVDIADTYAFGDSMNDASMLKAAGHGIAMENGAQQLKDMADYVTRRIDEDGIAHALKHFGLID